MSDNAVNIVVFIALVTCVMLTIGEPDILDGLIQMANRECYLERE